jgi:hypothetical protein
MHKTLISVEPLVFYDAVQLCTVTDNASTSYLCILVNQEKEKSKYLCVPISPAKLKSFRIGEIDTAEVFSNPEINDYYYFESTDIAKGNLELHSVSLDQIPISWFPENGFFYEEENISTKEEIEKRSKESGHAIFRLDLSPPESQGLYRIDTEKLLMVLSAFRSLVRNAYHKFISVQSKLAKLALDTPKNYELDIVGTSGGSFRVHLQSKAKRDLIGFVQTGGAFEIIDELTGHLDNKEQTLEIVKQYKGHLAHSFMKLLEVVKEENIPIAYSWMMPVLDKPKNGKIIRREIIPVLELLKTVKDLGVEKVEIIGKVVKADTKNGKWKIEAEENKRIYQGELSPKSKVTLSGIIMESENYKFFCEETIEEIIGIGNEKKKLMLLDYERIE